MAIDNAPHRETSLARTLISLLTMVAILGPTTTQAQDFLEATALAEIEVSSQSAFVREISRGGSQLSDGTPVPFDGWYRSNWRDLRVTMLTPLTDDLGILWGFGTGESGEKYRINPSAKIGFLRKYDLATKGTLSLSVTVVLGGFLKEKPCFANYGLIGGEQSVNCRLASSYLPPSETLELLYDERPLDQIEAELTYKLRF